MRVSCDACDRLCHLEISVELQERSIVAQRLPGVERKKAPGMIELAEKALSHAILCMFAISASDPLMWLHAALFPLPLCFRCSSLVVTER